MPKTVKPLNVFCLNCGVVIERPRSNKKYCCEKCRVCAGARRTRQAVKDKAGASCGQGCAKNGLKLQTRASLQKGGD